MAPARVEVASAADLAARLAAAPAAAVHFWAQWCEPCGAVDETLAALTADSGDAGALLRVEAEAHSEIAEAHGVAAVPCVLVFKGGKRVATIEGVNPPALAAAVEGAFGAAPPAAPAEPAAAPAAPAKRPVDDLAGLVRSHDVMLFMKGNPDAPRCGFSRKAVERLQATGHKFGTFDILEDEDVRQELKKFSQWPTYPQLYLKGELLGGNDIIQEMAESGELQKTFDEALKRPVDDLAGLVRSHDVMLFMKGNPDAPRCGFSRKAVERLQATGHKFGTFDILEDEDVRQELKKFSQWPTYPQLYLKGELLGGNDIIQEMAESGELQKTFDEALK